VTPVPPPSTRRVTITSAALGANLRVIIGAIKNEDELSVETAVAQLSRSRRVLAPLALLAGAFVMTFQGLKLLLSEWRLAVVQIVPALWIWAAMADLKFHALEGSKFHIWHGTLPVLFILAVVVLSVVAFYLNVAFAFAISRPGKPQIGPALAGARQHLAAILFTGVVIGGALGFSEFIVPDWGTGWFGLALGIMVGVMMVTYVAVPSRLVGLKAQATRRDRWTTTLVASILGAAVCAPAYILDRLGIMLLQTRALFVLGIVFLLGGVVFQVGLTGAIRAIKLSAKLVGRVDNSRIAEG
jgi:hypothetical protein